MLSWKALAPAKPMVWMGAFLAAGAAFAHPPGAPRLAAIAPEGNAWALAGGLSDAWTLAIGLGVAVLVILGICWWRGRRLERKIKQRTLDFHLEEARHRALFDNTPVQILEEDFTAVVAAFAPLRAQGILSLGKHFLAHPDLPREWRRLVRLLDANQPAVAAAGFANKAELIARFPQLDVPPYQEIFGHQLELLWAGSRLFEEELRYLDAQGYERACLVLFKMSERDGRPDPFRVIVVLLDTTMSKRNVAAQMEKQELLRGILGSANILLWWAQVHREDGRFRWKINVPAQAFDSPIFKLATAVDQGGLWDIEHAPDLLETSQRADQALLSGKPGYQQTFRVISREGVTHWLSEDVGISRLGENEWSFVGVVRDITEQHQAEEERSKSQAQLQQILSRADCMLWQARVTEKAGQFVWQFEAPASGLQMRIFDGVDGVKRQGVSGDVVNSLYAGFTMPDQAAMDTRCAAALRSGAPVYEQDFRLIKGDQTFWLHERVSIIPLQSGQWDLVGMTIDVTPQHTAEEARKASEARLQQLLTRADCLLWQARVVEDAAGEMQWTLYIPPSSLYQELFGQDPPGHPDLRWKDLQVSQLPEMSARSRAAMRSGAAGYEQDFQVPRPEKPLWLHEQASITRVGPSQWNLVGVITNVTAQHEAEEARKKSQVQLQQILTRPDCMLWQARVTESHGQYKWRFDIPPSGLQKRIFEGEKEIIHDGVTGIKAESLYGNFTVSNQVAMDEVYLQALRSGAPGYEQAFWLAKGDRTFWLHERVSIIPLRPGQWDFVGITIDVTPQHEAEEARKASEARLQQILTRADCLLWQANILREGGGVRWRNFTMPSSVLCERLFGDKPPPTGTGLWYSTDTPELPEMNRRSTEAILSGAPGYEQEFRVIRPGRTLWLHEQVSIVPVGPDEWNLVGVLMDVTPQHEAEEARKESEARLQEILTRADCMLWQARVTEIDGQISWQFDVPASRLQRRVLGGEGAIKTHRLYDDLPVPELPEMHVRGANALHSGAPGYEQEFRVVRPDHTFWLHERASIAPEGPNRWRVVGVVTDVSALKEAELVIRSSEERYRLMFDSNPNPLLVFDSETLRFLAVNEAAVQLYGYTREEFLAITAADIRPAEDVPQFLEIMRTRSEGIRHLGVRRHRTKDGRIVEVELIGTGLEFQGQQARMTFVRDVTEERRTRAALGASETRYQDLFESAVEGVYQSNAEGRFINVNPSLAQIFGCVTPEEFMAWTGAGAISLYVKPGRRAEFFAELGARDSVTDFESEVRCRDGSTKWITENVRAVRDSAGRLFHMQGFLSDITERRKALEAMRESEGRYRALFENMPVAILELDLRDFGRQLQIMRAAGVKDLSAHLAAHPEDLVALQSQMHIAAANEATVRLYQAQSKEQFQHDFERLFTAETETQRWLPQFITVVWQGGNDGAGAMAITDFAGKKHDVYAHWWMPRPQERLKVRLAVVAIVDLTELKHTEAALAAEKERLTVTLRAMSESVITTDTQGIVQYLNRAAAEMTQQDALAAIGRPLAEICVLQEAVSNQILPLPVTRVLGENVLVDLPPRTMLVGRQGATCLVEGCCAPLREADSRLIGTVLVMRDVTVRQRFEEELQRASRLESIGILAGGIAHDFNNILTAIMGNITLALLDAEALTKTERYLRDAERAALRARDLTQQLLTFAKGGDPVRSAVLLPEIVTEVARFALHGSRVKCEYDLPADLWLADADKGQLSQVVQNLVINAVQAMPEGGTIRISARNETVTLDPHRPLAPGDYVHISVADTGTGIKPEHVVKIFDPYFTTKQQGSGLGLTSVYSIIKKHNGHIEVESELGRGTTFQLWLPAVSERQLDFPEEGPVASTPLNGRVLFMDDEEPIILMAKLLLQRLGLEVELARDGAETVQKFAAAHAAGRPFDLVVMDLTVPGGMGGREAISELRRIDPGVKAVVSSGYSSDPVMANFRSYGFRGVVAKPYRIDDFARVLREVLRESRPPMAGSQPPGTGSA